MKELLHPVDLCCGCFTQVVLFRQYLPTGFRDVNKDVYSGCYLLGKSEVLLLWITGKVKILMHIISMRIG